MKKVLHILGMLFLFTLTVTAQDWQTDLTIAKQLAKENNKLIVLVFQGSDWCAPCIKLEKEIWSTSEFKKYAENHFVMLQADFPRKKKNMLSKEQILKNKELAEKYNTRGYFPFVVVLNTEGEVLGQTSYKKTTPAKYIHLLESFKG
ncbi:thioredoxin family protein [uncultured Maribacter sp.]|uniref:thioredoxin family protein n=1 Tax=uncultured Maribacter sp. TaxID=431308 RepID=UPI0026370DB5|nr:thioredoxin family protein [uncultured Maribacter sp.]